MFIFVLFLGVESSANKIFLQDRRGKKPLLIATDSSTDVGLIATKNNFGLWCASDDVERLSKNIDFFINNVEIRKQMGINACKFLCEDYDLHASYNAIMSHFKNIET